MWTKASVCNNDGDTAKLVDSSNRNVFSPMPQQQKQITLKRDMENLTVKFHASPLNFVSLRFFLVANVYALKHRIPLNGSTHSLCYKPQWYHCSAIRDNRNYLWVLWIYVDWLPIN